MNSPPIEGIANFKVIDDTPIRNPDLKITNTVSSISKSIYDIANES